MDKQNLVQISKRLSYLLRHHPEDLDLNLSNEGFTTITITELAERLDISIKVIYKIVEEDEKQRFTIENNHIRANYGHSIPVGASIYQDEKPIPVEDLPAYIYHGTSENNVDSIMKRGIVPSGRQFVHLSYSKKWARKVGSRHYGKTTIIRIDTVRALANGIDFYDAGPTTILSKKISPEYIEVLQD